MINSTLLRYLYYTHTCINDKVLIYYNVNDKKNNYCSVTEKDVIVCFVRINAFRANIDVNDNKQLFWF